MANGRDLVHEVSLSVAVGDRLAIIGPNGAGKTTLLRMLSGMLRPSSGEVKLGGRRLERISAAERALHIAVVGQTDQPDPRLAVIDYVELGRVPHAGRRRRSDERDIVVDALRRTGLLPLLGRTIGSLSGGERQRAQLARAIAQEPRILFLDEPTNHLDPRARGELLELVAGFGMTVIAVLHDLALVAPFATRVAVMNNARLQAFAAPREALTQQLIHQIFGVDVFRLRHPTEDRELTVFEVPNRAAPPSWKTELADITVKVGDRKGTRVFLYDSGEDKPFTAGRFAIPSAMISAAGGDNIMADMDTSWGNTDWETVASRNPQFLILLDYQDGGGYKKLLDFLIAHPAMKETDAVKNERFVALRYAELTPGPANIEAIDKIAKAMHPEAF
ncbi:ATP-binding cassette domain-containing protein [Mesorhizobium calcicola]|uniref:ATP-binding cassette domain-containing protein n=1 Tax=Mesorhizobium calcicola TaxID=1300310 RepID=A0ABW4W7H7_9HYPH